MQTMIILCIATNFMQVEGAFVMGLGYWLTEKIDYDTETGEIQTYNTWV